MKNTNPIESVLARGILRVAESTQDMRQRAWVKNAIQKISADFRRSADTHLLKFKLKAFKDIDFYLKDESTHLTGSLKHRLARSLFLYALCNGKVFENTTIVEASSGSTAISEAYFAKLLGLPFVAVVPNGTSPEKLASIEHYGGQIAFAASDQIYAKAQELADQSNGYYMDQFTYAERVTDWRGNNNIAESLFEQMSEETHPVPTWVVVGAGTGGTSATIGRYIRYKSEKVSDTKLCVADPEGSVFFDVYESTRSTSHKSSEFENRLPCSPSKIEGVGRPRYEPSFNPYIVDKMLKVSDSASIATAIWLEKMLNRKFGGSTGLNVFASLKLACEMQENNQKGSIVTLICDEGSRYLKSIHDEQWRREKGIDISHFFEGLSSLD